ncbi:4-hydroxyphenylacetate 3-hydroxylase C-terminal domain-containing protein [Paenibacillus aurantiacus]|uniref:4-hydroxyphenylacetate 3-hydroxylase C-terminal domain-containing protein n=1 Tax=Paenibacillus aurantiacus TaxID=1936118 RepID=A0ABV5KXP9_9BACL
MSIHKQAETVRLFEGDRSLPISNDLIAQAYSLPRSPEELRLKRSGFYELADGTSAFTDGWTDYAHALLAGWRAHESTVLPDEVGTHGAWWRLYKQSEHRRSVITTTLHPITRQDDGQPVARLDQDGGLLLRGRQTFGEDARFADELLVFIREEGAAEPTAAALIPRQTEGLRLTPTYGSGAAESSNGPVVAFYEEVAIPPERLWVGQDSGSLNRLLGHPLVKSLADYQRASRQLAAIELIAGTAFSLADHTGRGEELHIQGELGELIQGMETLKALLHAAELGAAASPAGVLLPAAASLHAAALTAGETYGRAVDALRHIGAAAFLANPFITTADSKINGQPSLLQFAWRLAGSSEAARGRLHEQHAFGDKLSLSQELYRHYPAHLLRSRYREFWQSLQPLDGNYDSEVRT